MDRKSPLADAALAGCLAILMSCPASHRSRPWAGGLIGMPNSVSLINVRWPASLRRRTTAEPRPREIGSQNELDQDGYSSGGQGDVALRALPALGRVPSSG